MDETAVIGFEGEIHLKVNASRGLKRVLEDSLKAARDIELWSLGYFGPKAKDLKFEVNFKGQGIPIRSGDDLEKLLKLWKPHFDKSGNTPS